MENGIENERKNENKSLTDNDLTHISNTVANKRVIIMFTNNNSYKIEQFEKFWKKWDINDTCKWLKRIIFELSVRKNKKYFNLLNLDFNKIKLILQKHDFISKNDLKQLPNILKNEKIIGFGPENCVHQRVFTSLKSIVNWVMDKNK